MWAYRDLSLSTLLYPRHARKYYVNYTLEALPQSNLSN